MTDTIPFIDLAAQQDRIRPKVDAAIARVLDHGGYVMGPEIAELERQLGDFAGSPQVLGCGSGTDALALPLMAWGLKAGDAVFCPSFTFVATAEVVAWLGATPVFVDVLPDTFNIDPVSLRQAIERVAREGRLSPKVVIAVDLFGQAADYPALREMCDEHGLKLVSDAAQGFGSTWQGQHSTRWADVVATSFFPAKPLGCYGDGGAILTGDEELADVMRSLRVHGMGEDRYDNVRIGMNGRLDTLQAAILIEKLAIFPEEIEVRNRVASRYDAGLGDVAEVPAVAPEAVFDLGPVHAEARKRPARSIRRGNEAGRRADGDLLPEAAAPPDRLPALPRKQRSPPRLRRPRRAGDLAADARLSRRGDAGPHRRRGTRGAQPDAFRSRLSPDDHSAPLSG